MNNKQNFTEKNNKQIECLLIVQCCMKREENNKKINFNTSLWNHF